MNIISAKLKLASITILMVLFLTISCNKNNNSNTPTTNTPTTTTSTTTSTNVPLANSASNFSFTAKPNRATFWYYKNTNGIGFQCDGYVNDASNNGMNIGTVTINSVSCSFNSLAPNGYRVITTTGAAYPSGTISATGTTTSGVSAFTLTTKPVPLTSSIDTNAVYKSLGITIKHPQLNADSLYYEIWSPSGRLCKKVATSSSQMFFTPSEVSNLTAYPNGKINLTVTLMNFIQTTISGKQCILVSWSCPAATVKLNP